MAEFRHSLRNRESFQNFCDLERVTINCSNLFCLDDYIKEYLKNHPELPIRNQLKLILRELLTHNIIEQLQEFMGHMGIVSFLKPLVMRRPT